MTTIWKFLWRYPPCACRLIARTPGRKPKALTTEEIARRSGLPVPVVLSLSEMTNWDHVTIDQLKRFSEACGVDFADRKVMKRINFYCCLKNEGKWKYLRNSPDWESYYYPLIQKWKGCYGRTQ